MKKLMYGFNFKVLFFAIVGCFMWMQEAKTSNMTCTCDGCVRSETFYCIGSSFPDSTIGNGGTYKCYNCDSGRGTMTYQCFVDETANGEYEAYWRIISYDCVETECVAGVEEDCSGDGIAEGVRTCSDSGEWGSCVPSECLSGYKLVDGDCVETECVAGVEEVCSGYGFTEGVRKCSDSGEWGSCVPSKCSTGYKMVDGNCYETCSIANGVGYMYI